MIKWFIVQIVVKHFKSAYQMSIYSILSKPRLQKSLQKFMKTNLSHNESHAASPKEEGSLI